MYIFPNLICKLITPLDFTGSNTFYGTIWNILLLLLYVWFHENGSFSIFSNGHFGYLTTVNRYLENRFQETSGNLYCLIFLIQGFGKLIFFFSTAPASYQKTTILNYAKKTKKKQLNKVFKNWKKWKKSYCKIVSEFF